MGTRDRDCVYIQGGKEGQRPWSPQALNGEQEATTEQLWAAAQDGD